MGFINKIFGGKQEEGQGMAAQLLSQLTTDLHLTGDQLNKIKAAFQQFREKRKGLKESGGNMKEQMPALKQLLKQEILSVLTDEQKQKFMANVDKYKEFFQK